MNKSKLESHILLALELFGEQYSLALIDTISHITNGGVKGKYNSIYVTLHRMEKKGLLKSRWGRERPKERAYARRRYYSLTDKGIQKAKQLLEN